MAGSISSPCNLLVVAMAAKHEVFLFSLFERLSSHP
jgi:hypothetical protein